VSKRSTHLAAMQRGRVANLDAELAKLAPGATEPSFETKLPMAYTASYRPRPSAYSILR
jgi:hypothetical protein